MNEPRWVEPSAMLALHQEQLAEFGGLSGVRDAGLLDSALSRPKNAWAYSSPKPDVLRLAAAYAFGLAKNHPFIDGNKRTALIVCHTFPRLNDYRLNAPQIDQIRAMLGLASGEIDDIQFENWLRSCATPVA